MNNRKTQGCQNSPFREPLKLTINNKFIFDYIKFVNCFAANFVTVALSNVNNHFDYNLSLPLTLSENNHNSMLFNDVTKSEFMLSGN